MIKNKTPHINIIFETYFKEDRLKIFRISNRHLLYKILKSSFQNVLWNSFWKQLRNIAFNDKETSPGCQTMPYLSLGMTGSALLKWGKSNLTIKFAFGLRLGQPI